MLNAHPSRFAAMILLFSGSVYARAQETVPAAETSMRWEVTPWLHLSHAATVGLMGLLIVIAYYALVWLAIGNKHFLRSVTLRPSAPSRVSPAALRYVDRMGYDQTVLTAAIVSMAVKGYLHIEDKDRALAIVRDEAPESVLSPEERELAHRIFDGRSKLVLAWSNRQILTALHRHFRYVLDMRYRHTYFRNHTAWRMAGVLLSTAAMVALFVAHFTESPGSDAIRRLLDLGLGGLCAAAGGLLAWHEYRRNQAGMAGRLPYTTGFAALALVLVGAGLMADASRAIYIGGFGSGLLILGLIMGVNWLALQRLPNFTREGWRLMLEAEGFRRFVQGGYKPEHEDVSNVRLFENGLPYAVALGVGEGWAGLFERSFVRLPKAEQDGLSYAPVWYSGLKWDRQPPSSFVASLLRTLTGGVTSMAAPAGHEPGPLDTKPRREEPPMQSPTESHHDE